MTKRELKKLELLRARAAGIPYSEIAERFDYQSTSTARGAVCNARRYIRERFPYLWPLNLESHAERGGARTRIRL